jgi:cation diffusion facilitator family transporter
LQAHIEQARAQHGVYGGAEHARERGIRAVIGLTLATMTLEIGVGHWTGSLALVADGWHMATHVGALGLAAGAYAVARRFAAHRAFAFGTGKVHALAGYTSAVALGFIAVDMVVESISRLLQPQSIDYVRSLPVAVLGLLVNLASVKLLHPGQGEHEAHSHGHAGSAHGHAHHDHNHRAAVAHVLADTFTSALAIGALLAGQFLGWLWLDPVSGMLGSAVVIAWAVALCRATALELLDVESSTTVQEQIRAELEKAADVQVTDLRVWPLGRGARGCVMTLSSAAPLDVSEYRRRVLGLVPLEHLTIEVRRHSGALPGAAPEVA